MQLTQIDRIRKWKLDSQTFNKWRAKEDIPRVFNFFKEELPYFKDWLASQKLEDGEIFSFETPSVFLSSSNIKYYCLINGHFERSLSLDTYDKYVVLDVDPTSWVAQENIKFKGNAYKLKNYKQFFPYLYWLKKIKKIKKIKKKEIEEIKNSLKVKTSIGLRVNDKTKQNGDFNLTWDGDYSNLFVILGCGLKLVSLGGVEINPHLLDGKNLDFLCLDGLTISNTPFQNGKKYIGYSTFQAVSIKDTLLNNITFYETQVSGLKVLDSNLAYIKFSHSSIQEVIIKNSRFQNLVFENSRVHYTFKLINSELLNLNVKLNKWKKYGLSSVKEQVNFYKTLKMHFKSVDDVDNFKKYEYLEKKREMYVYLLHLQQHLKYILIFFFQYSAKEIKPKTNFYEDLKKTILYFLHFIVWGFGLKPFYTIVSSFIVILIFMLKNYFFVDNFLLNGNFSESLSCSLLNFISFGCEIKTPIDFIEGFIGMVLCGFFIVGLSNSLKS